MAEIELTLSDEDIALLKEAAPFNMNLGTDEDQLWVRVTWIEEDESMKMEPVDEDT